MLPSMLARHSSWLRLRAAARHPSHLLQLQATARSCVEKDDDDEGDRKAARETLPGVDGRRSWRRSNESKSRDLRLLLPLSVDAFAAVAKQETLAVEQQKRQQFVKLPANADVEKFLSLIVSSSASLAPKDMERARTSVQTLAKELADPRVAVAGETGFQRARRQVKAATGKLDRMLHAMRQRRDFNQVEAVAFVWEDEMPQFCGNRKHWSVICEHYALALNYQQRFQDVVDKFFNCYHENGDDAQSTEGVSLLTPRLAQSIFVALGHLRDGARALQLLKKMECHDVHVTKVSYFHVLNALLYDERFTDFDKVMQICEEIVTKLPGEIVPLSLLPMIMMTAAACGESERAMKFYSHPPDMPMSTFTEFRFEICLQQLNHLGEDAMLMEMYSNLMRSVQASRDLKERVSKDLFRKRVALTTVATRNERLSIACEILAIMNHHKMRVSHHAIYPLLRVLLIDPLPLSGDGENGDEKHDEHVKNRVQCAKDLRKFFSRYPHSLEWNAFALCEAIIASVRADRADLVDDLFFYALDSGMPIKYAALEQMVVYYYRLGLISDLERVSDMVRALRLNKHIPLGIAVTEVGMAANLRLRRYDEVTILFEDFSSLDGEQRRVLQRRFMLKAVLKAYTHLGRGDEALAIQALIDQMHGTLLDESEDVGGDSLCHLEAKIRLDEESADTIDDSRCDQVGEQERLFLRRFNS